MTPEELQKSQERAARKAARRIKYGFHRIAMEDRVKSDAMFDRNRTREVAHESALRGINQAVRHFRPWRVALRNWKRILLKISPVEFARTPDGRIGMRLWYSPRVLYVYVLITAIRGA